MTDFHTLTVVAGLGRADHCEAARCHRPTPLRFVWHHILPQACGGKTEADNLASLCDSCHYSVHALLYELKTTGTINQNCRNGRKRVALAQQGYNQAKALGTVGKIPDEGSAIS